MTDLRFMSGTPEVIPSVVSVGSYDGVHLGHKIMLDQLRTVAKSEGLRSLIATFSPHPREFLTKKKGQVLTTLKERCDLLMDEGLDAFAVLTFDQELSHMAADRFVEEILVNRMGARALVIGHDHRFGYNREGDVLLLRSLGQKLGFRVHQSNALQVAGTTVSSSCIRKLVSEGKVGALTPLLGHPYSVTGTVIRGVGRGKTIGVPTANILPRSNRKMIPGEGVYAVRVFLPGETSKRNGMMNIGTRPTFEETGLHLEVNIIDYEGDLYDRELRVEFIERVRNEQKFDSIDELVQQLNRDRERCRRLLGEIP